MVFARTRITIWDQIYRPRKTDTIRYKGPHPERVYYRAYRLIKSVFNVPVGYIQEKLYNWEKEGNKERFSARWQVDKWLDKWTYIDWDIEIKGFSVNGKGEVIIGIEPRLVTEYPQDTIFQQSILYEILRRFWHVLFYERKREEFFEFGKALSEEWETKIKNFTAKLRASS
ncbi:MAG: hypothetical protein B6U68_02155 [Candidatus Aenigmarchaeota archaeon ex4484_14]|nr:MAG: hypothetical protein B6U68_02155 [Candidatus Aenigmarchaeota archaeon ex4484_14]